MGVELNRTYFRKRKVLGEYCDFFAPGKTVWVVEYTKVGEKPPRLYECLKTTFMQWARRQAAKAAGEGT